MQNKRFPPFWGIILHDLELCYSSKQNKIAVLVLCLPESLFFKIKLRYAISFYDYKF